MESNCYGVPLQLWHNTTLFKVGKIWGEIITLDDGTSKGLSLDVGIVKIYTEVLYNINQVIYLESKGVKFQIPVHCY